MDDFEETLPNHLFVSLRFEFKATRVIGTQLSPTTIKFKTDLSTLGHDSEEYSIKMETALTKLGHWVDNVLDGSIIICVDNDWALDSFMDAEVPVTSNAVVLCPEEPTDACLAELIFCKFKAISGDAFDFHGIDIEASDARGMGFTFVGGRPGEEFPSPEEWLGERNFFTKQWWNRNDASTLDVIPDEGSDLNNPPKWAYSLGFIAEKLANPSAPSNVVVRAEFRPRVIEGGKVD